jgi:hypothetical protein
MDFHESHGVADGMISHSVRATTSGLSNWIPGPGTEKKYHKMAERDQEWVLVDEYWGVVLARPFRWISISPSVFYTRPMSVTSKSCTL